jgi:hypothetical protein
MESIEVTSIESYFEILKEFEGKTVIFRGLDKQYKKLLAIVQSFCSCFHIRLVYQRI